MSTDTETAVAWLELMFDRGIASGRHPHGPAPIFELHPPDELMVEASARWPVPHRFNEIRD